MTLRCAVGLVAVIATLAAAEWPAVGQVPKRGGILTAMLMEDPPGFSIHESSTISGVWPVAPCYSNLVIFDPLKPVEPYVKNLVPHNSLYNYARMQEVWLDK